MLNAFTIGICPSFMTTIIDFRRKDFRCQEARTGKTKRVYHQHDF
jgi:hypothetical protein